MDVAGNLFSVIYSKSAKFVYYFSIVLTKCFSFVSDRSFLVANSREGQCHIIYCSDGFCRLTGYSRAEVMQRPASCEFLCGPLTSQQSVSGLRDALNDGHEKHAELLYYRKDGKLFHLIFCFLKSTEIKKKQKTARNVKRKWLI